MPTRKLAKKKTEETKNSLELATIDLKDPLKKKHMMNICKDMTEDQFVSSLTQTYARNFTIDDIITKKVVPVIYEGKVSLTITREARIEKAGDMLDGISEAMFDKDIRGEYVKVEVYKKGTTHPFVGKIYIAEYDKANTKQGFMYKVKKNTMLIKCAHVAAMRLAFSDTAGMYDPDELNIVAVQDADMADDKDIEEAEDEQVEDVREEAINEKVENIKNYILTQGVTLVKKKEENYQKIVDRINSTELPDDKKTELVDLLDRETQPETQDDLDDYPDGDPF